MQTMLAAAVEETRSAVSSVTGQVRIAITDTVSEHLLPMVIAAIRERLSVLLAQRGRVGADVDAALAAQAGRLMQALRR